MISVEQALTEILSRLPDRQTMVCPLADSLGCVLAQDIQSDIDSLPMTNRWSMGMPSLPVTFKQKSS